jgi:hypothetical protein
LVPDALGFREKMYDERLDFLVGAGSPWPSVDDLSGLDWARIAFQDAA